MFSPVKGVQVTTENDRGEKITTAGKTSESQFDLILDKHRFDSVKKFAQAFFDHFKFILPIKTVNFFVFFTKVYINWQLLSVFLFRTFDGEL